MNTLLEVFVSTKGRIYEDWSRTALPRLLIPFGITGYVLLLLVSLLLLSTAEELVEELELCRCEEWEERKEETGEQWEGGRGLHGSGRLTLKRRFWERSTCCVNVTRTKRAASTKG